MSAAGMDVIASIRVGQAPPRQCRVTQLELDGMFVQDLYGVVQNERVEIELTVPGRPAMSVQGTVRRVVDALEAQKRSATSGVAIAWTHPPAELLAAIDELDEDSVVDPSEEEITLVRAFNEALETGRPREAIAAAQALEGMTPHALRYKIARELARGLHRREIGDGAGADECFKKALDLDPTREAAALLLQRKDAGTSAIDNPADRLYFRAHPRHRVRLPARVKPSRFGNDGTMVGEARDLSEGGAAFVPTARRPSTAEEVGTMLHLTLGVPGSKAPLKLRARIARRVAAQDTGEPMLGLEFVNLRPSDLDAIRSLMSRTV
jgi:tetratricopeptide (TPR) repeat protein